MVQVLSYVPSPLEQLTPAISQLAGGLGGAVGSYQRNKKDEALLAQLQKMGSMGGDTAGSPMGAYTIWQQLSPELRKSYEPFLASQLRVHEAEQKQRTKNEMERETKKLEKAEKLGFVNNAAQQMLDLVDYTGGLGTSLGKEAIHKREEFDELAASAASFFRDLETKGQLPIGLFNQVIKNRLPNSELRRDVNIGKIKGIMKLIEAYKDQIGGASPSKKPEMVETPSERPPLTSFVR